MSSVAEMDSARKEREMMTEYQKQQAKQEADEAAFVAKLATIEIPGWNFGENPSPRHTGHGFTHTESGAYFSVQTYFGYSARDGKVTASATWPSSEDSSYMSLRDWGVIKYGEEDPHSIGFSYGKSAKAIASDFTRRLIPGLVEKTVEINAIIASRAAARETIEADAKALCAAASYQWAEQVKELSHYSATVRFDCGEARLSKHDDGNTVELKLGDLSLAQTLEILAIVNK